MQEFQILMHSIKPLDELVCFFASARLIQLRHRETRANADRFRLGHIGLSYTSKQLIAREVYVLLI